MTNAFKQKLKILIIAETYPPEINGAANFSERLAKGLHQLGHHVVVIAPNYKKGKSCTANKNGIVEHRLHSHSVFTHLTFRICFTWQIKKEVQAIFDGLTPDIVHIQCHFSIGRVAVNEANRRHIPIVSTIHVMPENITAYLPFPKWTVKLIVRYLFQDMSKVLRKVNVITMPTQLAARAINEKIKLPIVTISNGIDSEKYELKNTDHITKRTNTVLFVGRLAKEKQIDVLIHAIAHIPPELYVHLEIVGHGEILEELKNLAKNLNISERVKFLGVLSEESLRKTYLQASLFCMPGIAELQSLATLEAMSASLPVLLADALALPHLVEEGKNGYLFHPGNSIELATKIQKIIKLPPDLHSKMGQSSRALAAKHDIKRTLTRFECLYRELLKEKSKV